MRTILLALSLLVPLTAVNAVAESAPAADRHHDPELSVALRVGIPGGRLGLRFNQYPHLTLIPGYPVYYAPQLASNYFFYENRYWVFEEDDWYTSDWYDGPWYRMERDEVPLFLLRVPVRYYRRPPPFFVLWALDAPPRWGSHWGAQWERRHRHWDRWDQRRVPRPTPLPPPRLHRPSTPRPVDVPPPSRHPDWRAPRAPQPPTLPPPQAQPPLTPPGVHLPPLPGERPPFMRQPVPRSSPPRPPVAPRPAPPESPEPPAEERHERPDRRPQMPPR